MYFNSTADFGNFRIVRFNRSSDSCPIRCSASSEGYSMRNIFVGNLTFGATEDAVRSMFEAYGPVDRVSIVTDRDTGRSKGFGFVEMPNDSEGDSAINALNGSELDGRNLTINEARPKSDGGGGNRGGRGGGGGGRQNNRW